MQRCSSAVVTRPIGSANRRAGVSSGQRAVAPARQREAPGNTGSSAGSVTAVTPAATARQRVGSAATNQRRRNATRRNSPAVATAATDERRRGCDAMNGALSTGRMRDFDEIATTRWSYLWNCCRLSESSSMVHGLPKSMSLASRTWFQTVGGEITMPIGVCIWGDIEDVYGFAVAELARLGVHIHLPWGLAGLALPIAIAELARWVGVLRAFTKKAPFFVSESIGK
ncbi:hypothetical protein Scep_021335 [Stephania cephalantha]|uniref:Uncharacterized protein n=1 Tax=Stephania cephalantha TaxID=152367 RepID=A0AAP0I1C0_9MAGN